MRQRINTKLSKSSLRLTKLNNTKEQFGKCIWVVLIILEKRFGNELEFRFERLELEFRLVVELGSVEKDEEREGARVVGENAAEERVGEMDSGVVGGGSERLEFRERVRGRKGERDKERDEEEREEERGVCDRHFGELRIWEGGDADFGTLGFRCTVLGSILRISHQILLHFCFFPTKQI